MLVLDFAITQGPFTLEIRERIDARLVALWGPSGSGKTTLLEAIAGLCRPHQGEIMVASQVLFSSSRGIDLPPRERGVGYVPQDTLLFPHLDVRRNIAFGLARGSTVSMDRAVGLLDIAPLMGRHVRSLSGGERQRVALARALVSGPRLLLLDEPLSGVEIPLRRRIVEALVSIRDELQIPMVYVTHEPAEIQPVADAIVQLEGGRVRPMEGAPDSAGSPISAPR